MDPIGTTDYPIDKEVTTIYTDSLAKWTQLVDLLASTYPDIHQIMRARNTNTNKAFSDIWTQMRGLYLKVIDSTENVSWETYKQYLEQNISYLKVIDSTENVSWETYKQYLEQNISYTPYLATEDILTVMTGVNKLKTSTNQAEDLNHGHESTTTFTYPEQQGKYYVQMKVFKFADVLSVSPEKLWTKALQDMKFVISDRAEDEITKHTMNLVSAVHRHSRDHPKTAQSVKRKRFTNW
ncbi:hypothetical protein QE152_g1134 [Popillia japonica]|uniref:Gag protein n=1 Tax=Popillia japonica TaxID=7064 RepID=A0AAW1NAJ8_POPJA